MLDGVNAAQSGYARAADGLVLVALCLGMWAGVASRSAAHVLFGLAVAVLAAAVALYAVGWRSRREAAPGRIAILAIASVLAWGTLGVGAASGTWPVAAVSLVAAAAITWRLLGALGTAREVA
jgi:hypothetical protein